jgi:tetratricopeptide (TPR) repeat protein
MAVAVPALAQQPASSGYPAPCDASKVTKADVDRAHQVFLSGKGFLDESNYDKAISYFKDAYSIDCSVHGILPIIATAYERKGDKASAIGALQEYLKRAPNASDREIIERRIKNLQDQLSHEQPTATATAPTATATATAQPSATATSTAAPTATTTATAPTATSTGGPPPPEAEHSVWPWVLVGVGGAAVVTAAVLYPIGASDVSSADSACPSRHNCPTSVADQGNSGRTLETVAVVSGSVGLAAIAGGLVWHFVLEQPASPATGTHVTPVVAPGYAGLGVGGSF